MRDGLHLLVIDIDVHGQFIMVENVWVTNIYAPNDVIQRFLFTGFSSIVLTKNARRLQLEPSCPGGYHFPIQ